MLTYFSSGYAKMYFVITSFFICFFYCIILFEWANLAWWGTIVSMLQQMQNDGHFTLVKWNCTLREPISPQPATRCAMDICGLVSVPGPVPDVLHVGPVWPPGHHHPIGLWPRGLQHRHPHDQTVVTLPRPGECAVVRVPPGRDGVILGTVLTNCMCFCLLGRRDA